MKWWSQPSGDKTACVSPGQACVRHSNCWKKAAPVNKSFKTSQSLMLVSGLTLPPPVLFFLRTHLPVSLECFCCVRPFCPLGWTAGRTGDFRCTGALALVTVAQFTSVSVKPLRDAAWQCKAHKTRSSWACSSVSTFLLSPGAGKSQFCLCVMGHYVWVLPKESLKKLRLFTSFNVGVMSELKCLL